MGADGELMLAEWALFFNGVVHRKHEYLAVWEHFIDLLADDLGGTKGEYDFGAWVNVSDAAVIIQKDDCCC